MNGTQLDFEVHTGFFGIDWYYPDSNNTGIFFEMVTKKGETLNTTSPTTPVVFWFQGGPGCGSQFGSWVEMGPLYFDQYQNMQLRPNTSWNELALVIYVDQPLNSGFSYSDVDTIVNNTYTAGAHFINFLYHFFTQYSQLKQNPIYFFGESYGGHYVPYFAYSVLTNTSFPKINLIGIGVGDGLTDSVNQIQTYDAYYYSVSIASTATRNELLQEEIGGLQDYAANNLAAASNNLEFLTNQTAFFGNIQITNYEQYGNPNPYYIQWLSNTTTAQQYGVPTFIQYTDCNNTIYNAFQIDIAVSFKQYFEYLIQNNLKVVLYNGQLDILVNSPGTTKWVNSMNWTDLNQWQQKLKDIWQINQVTVGTFKNYNQFTQMIVYGAGHMVPQDQPVSAFDILNRTLNWNWKAI